MEELRELMCRCIEVFGKENLYTVMISQMLDILIAKMYK